MTQQFNTLLMWREEVVKVQQTHKEKFAETKEYILKVRLHGGVGYKYTGGGGGVSCGGKRNLNLWKTTINGGLPR